MLISEFIKTIYLGDRGCKSILLDGWNGIVKIQITCISRVREKAWNYYADEDLIDGWLVFSGVNDFQMTPPGWIPNDSIDWQSCETLSDGTSRIILVSSSADEQGGSVGVEISIAAKNLAIENSHGLKIDSSEKMLVPGKGDG